ncbi:MAG: STAS domain-containing protein [Deltaproteobacteria bacterium]|nr:STAS domain-containing protein [Deltaproteobacteria bacterium]
MAGSKKRSDKKTIKPGKEIVESMVDDFREKLLGNITQDIKDLAIDMKNVKEMDSTGLAVLIAAKNSLDQAGGQLSLTNVPENIESYLQVLGLEEYFNQGFV